MADKKSAAARKKHAHKAVAKKGKRARKAAPERKRHARPVGNAEAPAAKVKRGEKQAAPKQAKKAVKAGDEEGEADELGEAAEPDVDLAAPDGDDEEAAADAVCSGADPQSALRAVEPDSLRQRLLDAVGEMEQAGDHTDAKRLSSLVRKHAQTVALERKQPASPRVPRA